MLFKNWSAKIDGRRGQCSASMPRQHPFKSRSRLLGVVIIASFVLAGAKVSLAARPLVIDDAAPVPAGHMEVEFGVSHARLQGGGREQAVPVMMSAYGIMNFLEFGLGIQRVNNDLRGEPPARGFEDVHLLAKLRLIEEKQIWPATALSLDVSVPTANKAKGLSTGKSDQALTLILSKLYEPAGLHLNLGYLLVESPRGDKLKNRFTGGIAADYGIHPAIALVGEVFGSSRASKGEKNEAAFHLGLRYALNSNLVFDVAAGRSLRSSGASVQGTAGLTWTIDIANYPKSGN
jgi:hypothetical protein